MDTVRYLLQNSKLSYVRVTCVMLLVKGLFKEVTQKSVDTFVREFPMQLRKKVFQRSTESLQWVYVYFNCFYYHHNLYATVA